MNETDEFAGMGGSYLLDEKTSKRVLVQRTKEPAPFIGAPQPSPVQSAPAGVSKQPSKES